MTTEDYLGIVRERLSMKRVYHSLCVAEAAADIAGKCRADADDAYLAGLLHDICKETNDGELLQIFMKFGILLSAVESREHKLWHAMAGALVLHAEFPELSGEILRAVRYHTTGRAGMSPLEKTLYLADFISKDRKFDGVEGIRAAAELSPQRGIAAALQFTVADLSARGCAIHPDTVEAYNELICAGAQ